MTVYDVLFEDKRKIQPSRTVLQDYYGQTIENLSIAKTHCKPLSQASYNVIPFYIITEGIVPVLGPKSLKSFSLLSSENKASARPCK